MVARKVLKRMRKAQTKQQQQQQQQQQVQAPAPRSTELPVPEVVSPPRRISPLSQDIASKLTSAIRMGVPTEINVHFQAHDDADADRRAAETLKAMPVPHAQAAALIDANTEERRTVQQVPSVRYTHQGKDYYEVEIPEEQLVDMYYKTKTSTKPGIIFRDPQGRYIWRTYRDHSCMREHMQMSDQKARLIDYLQERIRSFQASDPVGKDMEVMTLLPAKGGVPR